MTWLLIITLSFPGEPDAVAAAGLMASEDLCRIAGAGMSSMFERANPGLTATWSCMPEVAA